MCKLRFGTLKSKQERPVVASTSSYNFENVPGSCNKDKRRRERHLSRSPFLWLWAVGHCSSFQSLVAGPEPCAVPCALPLPPGPGSSLRCAAVRGNLFRQPIFVGPNFKFGPSRAQRSNEHTTDHTIILQQYFQHRDMWHLLSQQRPRRFHKRAHAASDPVRHYSVATRIHFWYTVTPFMFSHSEVHLDRLRSHACFF
jgi:hypothetical protein